MKRKAPVKRADVARAESEFANDPMDSLSDINAAYADMLDMNLGGGTMVGNVRVSDSPPRSNPSSEHSYVGEGSSAGGSNKKDAKKRRNKKRTCRIQEVDGEGLTVDDEEAEDEDEDPGDGSMVENINRAAKLAKVMNFTGDELMKSKYLTGEYIKTSRREMMNLQKFADNDDIFDDDDDDGYDDNNYAGAGTRKKTLRQLMIGDENEQDGEDICDEDDPLVTNPKELADIQKRRALKKHTHCLLCTHASMTTEEVDRDFMNAYQMIVDLDIAKHGLTSDLQLFKEMKLLFNTQQRLVKQQGGRWFFLTVQEISEHFREHDISNPLRPIGERIKGLEEIMRRGSKYIFGESNGRKYWNEQYSKLYLSVLNHHRIDTNLYRDTRASMVASGWNPRSTVGGVLSKTKNPLAGQRHMTGADADRRYGSRYVR